MRGKRDNRNWILFAALFENANGLRRFKPIHFRHRAIHQDEIERFCLRALDGFAAVHYQTNIEIELGERFLDDLAVYCAVICGEYTLPIKLRARRIRRAGTL